MKVRLIDGFVTESPVLITNDTIFVVKKYNNQSDSLHKNINSELAFQLTRLI
eukprot:Pgem_evm1s12782